MTPVLLKTLTRSIDRIKLILSSKKRSSIRHQPYTRDYSHLTRQEYLEHPELFYRKPPPVNQVRILRTEFVRGFKRSYLTFQSPYQTPYLENNTVYGIYTTVDKPGTADWVLIVLHGWGRPHFRIEKKMCLTLARHGISSLLLTMPYHQERAPAGSWSGEYMISGDVVRTAESFQQTIAEVQAIIPWLRQKFHRVGIFGMSLGGIIAHLAMTVEPFDAGITLLAGGNSAKIVWEGQMTQYVREDIERAGITLEQLELIWLATNPTNLAPRNRVKNLLMINGQFDEIIPVSYTLELWEALGKPPIKWYPCAHYSSYFFLKRILRDIVEFIATIQESGVISPYTLTLSPPRDNKITNPLTPEI
jgi:dienelactone hydrolase